MTREQIFELEFTVAKLACKLRRHVQVLDESTLEDTRLLKLAVTSLAVFSDVIQEWRDLTTPKPEHSGVVWEWRPEDDE